VALPTLKSRCVLIIRSEIISTSGLGRRHFVSPISADVGHVDSATSESGMIENVGLAAKIVSISLSVKTLFPLPVCVADILSSDVGNTNSRPGVVKHVEADLYPHFRVRFYKCVIPRK
jgi:hypothetical protein